MKNWGRKKIVDISTVFEDGDWIESKDQSAEGIRLIQTGNVGNGIFKDRGEKARYISEDTFKNYVAPRFLKEIVWFHVCPTQLEELVFCLIQAKNDNGC
ncbi:MAG: hypothetical protein R2850_00940 [Bacteroidia bacterium]